MVLFMFVCIGYLEKYFSTGIRIYVLHGKVSLLLCTTRINLVIFLKQLAITDYIYIYGHTIFLPNYLVLAIVVVVVVYS